MGEPTVKDLVAKIAQLEATVEALNLKLEKQIKDSAGMERFNTALRMGTESQMEDIGERVKNIELTIFPKLSKDIFQLHEIVPMDGKAWNPFDYRYPWKK